MLRKQFHNFLTLFNTTTLNNSKLFLFISFKSYSKVIEIGRKIHCISKKKKKTPRTYKKTQREKSLYFVPRLTSSCKEKKRKKKEDEHCDTFHSWPSKWASNFPRCINEPVIKLPIRDYRFATRSSETKVENQSPRSSIHFSHELRGRDHASDYVESR